VPTFAGRECRVVIVTDPYGHILGFLDRLQIQLAPKTTVRQMKFEFQVRVTATMLSHAHNRIVSKVPTRVRDMFPASSTEQNALNRVLKYYATFSIVKQYVNGLEALKESD
jgi:hypothetical protein